MTYQEEFITFMVRAGVLTFGDFTTKSGRRTPYFINTGNYKTGEQISKLYEKERCLTTVIGDKLELTVEVMQQKGGSETTETYQMTLPHNIDGIIINLPAYMAGLPEEAYLEEFIPAPPTEEDDEEEVYKIVTTVRGNSLKNLISNESPLGKALLGHKVGDRVEVAVNENYSYYVVIRKIENTVDDGSDKIRRF